MELKEINVILKYWLNKGDKKVAQEFYHQVWVTSPKSFDTQVKSFVEFIVTLRVPEGYKYSVKVKEL